MTTESFKSFVAIHKSNDYLKSNNAKNQLGFPYSTDRQFNSFPEFTLVKW